MPQCSSSYTAAGASRTMYSMASWSPSQSAPLTVSYMCQRQSSSPMLPSDAAMPDRKSTRLNSSHTVISYAVFCLKKKTLDEAHRSARLLHSDDIHLVVVGNRLT